MFLIKEVKSYLFSMIIILLLTSPVFGQDTIKVMCYNLQDYTPMDTSRNQYFRTIIGEIKPDLLVVEEITSQVTTNIFLNDVLKAINSNYAAGDFISNTYSSIDTTNNALFYRTDRFNFVSITPIHTYGIRDIDAFKLIHINSKQSIILFGVHLKANSGTGDQSVNELKRNNGAVSLRSYTDMLPVNTNFLVLGDFNIFSADEPAYKTLTTVYNKSGYFIDPINMTGVWNNNVYAQFHTHSTRYSVVYGGLNNRLDLILYSFSVSQPGGIHYISNSTVAYGNDGLHYNNSIEYSPSDTAVSENMLDALYNASDHLPVYALFTIEKASEIMVNKGVTPKSFALYQNYPNPFNPSTTISYYLPEEENVALQLYNMLGQEVETLVSEKQISGQHSIKFYPDDLSSGIYIYRLTAGGFSLSRKMIIMR
jgi:hypothetical protein